MQLTLYTDYSIRVLLYLSAKPGSPSTITEVANAFGISRNHLVKVVHNLSTNGYIRTTRGKKGGMVLGRSAREISIGDLVRKTEPDFKIVECFGEETSTCPIDEVCSLKFVLRSALSSFLKTLDSFTLADITENAGLLRPILVDGVQSRTERVGPAGPEKSVSRLERRGTARGVI
uniref:Rrf2 family transcriptional regulator n=1 Tax=Leptospirillum ferriphilum TaxID=178606 RepID=A0A7C3QUM0_9BACT